jgi:hypothetical protein
LLRQFLGKFSLGVKSQNGRSSEFALFIDREINRSLLGNTSNLTMQRRNRKRRFLKCQRFNQFFER